jgi:phenylpropionate dioxygenase-like ring-hydroxylating dioxygenase large terminal subunit
MVLLDNDDGRLRRAWHPVARSVDIGPAPKPVRLNGEDYTLARDGDVARPGHGREGGPYSRVSVREGAARGIQELYGLVWLAQDEPVHKLPVIPEWFDTGYHSAVLLKNTHVSAGVLTDNFLDVTHFSYLHQRTFGLVRPVTVERYDLDLGPWEVRLTHETRLHESSDPAGLSRVAVYLYRPPYVTHLRMSFPPGEGDDSASTLVCQPESATSTVAYVIVGWPAHDTPGLRAQVALSDAVLAEDLAMVEQIEDPRLPLAIRAELHTRADRAGVEMRRMLTSYLAACAGPALS